MGLVLQMFLTSATPGQSQIHQHWNLDGSSKASKSSHYGFFFFAVDGKECKREFSSHATILPHPALLCLCYWQCRLLSNLSKMKKPSLDSRIRILWVLSGLSSLWFVRCVQCMYQKISFFHQALRDAGISFSVNQGKWSAKLWLDGQDTLL